MSEETKRIIRQVSGLLAWLFMGQDPLSAHAEDLLCLQTIPTFWSSWYSNRSQLEVDLGSNNGPYGLVQFSSAV